VHLTRLLSPYGGVLCGPPLPIPCLPPTPPSTPHPFPTPSEGVGGVENTPTHPGEDTSHPSKGKVYLKKFPDEAIPALVRLVHGSLLNKVLLGKEFAEHWWQQAEKETKGDQTPKQRFRISKRILEGKISEIGEYKKCPEEGPFINKSMWYVSPEVREQHGLSSLGLPNSWELSFVTPKEDKRRAPEASAPSAKSVKTTPVAPPSSSLITKFAKVFTEEEKEAAIASGSRTPKVPAICVTDDSDDIVMIPSDVKSDGVNLTPKRGDCGNSGKTPITKKSLFTPKVNKPNKSPKPAGSGKKS